MNGAIQLATESVLEKEFQSEMRRFLPLDLIDSSVSKPEFWTYLVSEIDAACTAAERALKTPEGSVRVSDVTWDRLASPSDL